jgi:hypothetical protein
MRRDPPIDDPTSHWRSRTSGHSTAQPLTITAATVRLHPSGGDDRPATPPWPLRDRPPDAALVATEAHHNQPLVDLVRPDHALRPVHEFLDLHDLPARLRQRPSDELVDEPRAHRETGPLRWTSTWRSRVRRPGSLVFVSRESSVRPPGGSRVRCHSAPPSSTASAVTPGPNRVDIATGAPVLVDPGSTLCGGRMAYPPLRGPSCRRCSRFPARPCAASPRTPGAGSPLMPRIPGTRRSWR